MEGSRTVNMRLPQTFLSLPLAVFIAAVAGLSSVDAQDAEAPSTMKTEHLYATVDGHELKLDLIRPVTVENPPLLVWIHGGAWRAGSRENPQVLELVNMGWAIASVDYRLSPVAKFPAQVHDIKAAIRFLRAHAAEHKCRVDKIAIAGASAGGHLAALVGVTNAHAELEGKVGDNPEADSSVQAIVSLYGGSNLESILAQSTPHGLNVRVPALELLLGATPDKVPDLARLASPVAHVDSTDPPLLLVHGDQDPQMPINQAHELQGAYEKLGLRSQFKVLHGAAHGGEAFYDAANLEWIDGFLRAELNLAAE
jgi:acetyl esterase/lipase